jgi:hypothetical protein
MYTANGMVQGLGTYTLAGTNSPFPPSPVNGEWTTDDNGRICTSMRIGGGGGTRSHGRQRHESSCSLSVLVQEYRPVLLL